MAALSGSKFYGDGRKRDRQRISDATADEILEIIARGHTSDMDLSDSNDDVADATFSAPALPDAPSSDEDHDASDDEESSTSCRTKQMPSWEAGQAYFTSGALLDKLAEMGIAGTGTIMNNRIPKGAKLSTEKELKAKGRGTSEMK
ncbi:hypothetical protein HPB47_018366, partial [Ixodes persulcatus]